MKLPYNTLKSLSFNLTIYLSNSISRAECAPVEGLNASIPKVGVSVMTFYLTLYAKGVVIPGTISPYVIVFKSI